MASMLVWVIGLCLDLLSFTIAVLHINKSADPAQLSFLRSSVTEVSTGPLTAWEALWLLPLTLKYPRNTPPLAQRVLSDC